jgi:pyruvate kinase
MLEFPTIRKRKILCTLGPASMNERVIQRLDRIGVDLFRLNLSHTDLNSLEPQINLIRQHTRRPICLDTEGAQVRTGRLESGSVDIRLNDVVRFVREPVVGRAHEMNLYPEEVYGQLEEQDILYLDFNSVMVQVVCVTPGFIEARALAGGVVGQNKAVVVKRAVKLPPLTAKDIQAIKTGLELGIQHIALSFASRGEDVDQLRGLVGGKVELISKIECLSGMEHLSEITARSQAILIDRGDLGREVRIEALPFLQKAITHQANSIGVPVYIATNLLESMVSHSQPTRAEVNDIMNTLLDGADGLVLAAETAIGGYPVECVSMIDKLIRYFERAQPVHAITDELRHFNGRGVEYISPHSGDNHRVGHGGKGVKRSSGTRQLMVEDRVIMDADQIARGIFAPLKGFMTRHTLTSVLDDYRLPSGDVWTLPVLLQLDEKSVQSIKLGQEVMLTGAKDGVDYAVLTIADIFTQDLQLLARKWFGTDDRKHPGVQKLLHGGDYFLGGPVQMLRRRRTPYLRYEFMPDQTRDLFETRGWSVVVGFHTRNVPHRAHEKLLKLAFERFGADGLFISPVVGPKKSGDYNSDIVLKSYELLIDRQYLPRESTVLGAFSTYPRYSGPREAVFTAICRRNFGCTHFIVGRDHTGVLGYYRPEESQALFRTLGDIGIKPVFFDSLNYCQICDDHVEVCEHGVEGSNPLLALSGTQARNYFCERKAPPDWFMRPEISAFILQELSRGERVFIE